MAVENYSEIQIEHSLSTFGQEALSHLELGVFADFLAKEHYKTLDPKIKKYTSIKGIDAKKLKDAITVYKKAIGRLERNKKFTQMFQAQDYAIDRFFPLMIKESRLDATVTGSNNSQGYFQVNDVSKKATEVFMSEQFGITKSYNISDPVENCIVGLVYHLGVLEKEYTIENNPHIHDKDKFRHAQYNCGSSRLKGVLKIYQEETKEQEIYWDAVVKWILGKIGGQKEFVVEQDTAYTVPYRNWFADDKTVKEISNKGKQKLVVYGEGKYDYLSYQKAQTVIRYVEIIAGMKNVHESREECKVPDNCNSEVLEPGMTLYGVCKKHGVAKYAPNIWEYNRKHNPSFRNLKEISEIPVGTILWIPKRETGFYQGKSILPSRKENGKKKNSKTPEKKEYKDYKERYNAGNKYYLEKYEIRGKKKISDIYKNLSNPDFIDIKHGNQAKNKLKKVKKIVLHSTGGEYINDKESAKKIYSHFYISRDGKIFRQLKNGKHYQLSHAGRSCWDGDKKVSYRSIGIEIEASDGNEWTDAQYLSLKKVLKWIAEHYNPQLKASDIVTHSQVAYSKFGRGRKPDPYYVNWTKLGLPNNYTLFDRDVVEGNILPNLTGIQKDWEKRGVSRPSIENMTSGLRISSDISK